MVYILTPIIGVLCFVVFELICRFKISNLNYRKRILLLEEIILQKKSHLEIQNQKIKLSEDLRLKLNASNKTLMNSIFNLNQEIFKELYARE